MPAREKEWCAHWKSLNKGWNYQLWDDAACEAYATDPYVRFLRETGEKTAFIVDRLRVLILRDHGGFYIDTDAMPVRPLDTLHHIWDDPKVDFVTGMRSPDRQNVSLGRGVAFVDNTIMAAAKGGRMIRLLDELWRPEAKRQVGSACGRQVLRHADETTVLLNYRYFYDMRETSQTIALHDGHNSGSWFKKESA